MLGYMYNARQCEDFAREFPSGEMKAEYAPGQPRISLGDRKWMLKPRAALEHLKGCPTPQCRESKVRVCVCDVSTHALVSVCNCLPMFCVPDVN